VNRINIIFTVLIIVLLCANETYAQEWWLLFDFPDKYECVPAREGKRNIDFYSFMADNMCEITDYDLQLDYYEITCPPQPDQTRPYINPDTGLMRLIPDNSKTIYKFVGSLKACLKLSETLNALKKGKKK